MGAAEVAAILAPFLLTFAKRTASEARDALAARLGRVPADVLSNLWERIKGHSAAAEPETPGHEREMSEERVAELVSALLTREPELLERARQVAIEVRGTGNVVQSGRTNINISGGSNINIRN